MNELKHLWYSAQASQQGHCLYKLIETAPGYEQFHNKEVVITEAASEPKPISTWKDLVYVGTGVFVSSHKNRISFER